MLIKRRRQGAPPRFLVAVPVAVAVVGWLVSPPESRAAQRQESNSPDRMLERMARERIRPAFLDWSGAAEGGGLDPRVARYRLGWIPLGSGVLPLPASIPDPERWQRAQQQWLAASSCPCPIPPLPGPGEVPDGAAVAGEPLRVTRSAADPATLSLSWGASCSEGAADYTVHLGTLGDWYSHSPAACSTGGQLSTPLPLPDGDRYFLVVPVDAVAEGGYGSDSGGWARPASISPCRPAVPAVCAVR